MPIVNGHQAETGCYVEGSWGQYGPDHLADQAETFGWRPDGDADEYPNEGYSNDPRFWRRVALRHEDHGDEGAAADAWQRHVEVADAIETWLNDHTPILCLNCNEPMEWREGIYRAVHLSTGGVFCRSLPKWPMGKPQSFTWHWHDGEFFLSRICDPDNREECTDDECAHWD